MAFTKFLLEIKKKKFYKMMKSLTDVDEDLDLESSSKDNDSKSKWWGSS